MPGITQRRTDLLLLWMCTRDFEIRSLFSSGPVNALLHSLSLARTQRDYQTLLLHQAQSWRTRRKSSSQYWSRICPDSDRLGSFFFPLLGESSTSLILLRHPINSVSGNELNIQNTFNSACVRNEECAVFVCTTGDSLHYLEKSRKSSEVDGMIVIYDEKSAEGILFWKLTGCSRLIL